MSKEIKRKGISLVALVITIIVLVVLTGAVVIISVGDDGIISKSSIASEKYRASEIQETIFVAISNNALVDYVGGTYTTKEDIVDSLKKQKKLTNEEVEVLKTQNIITIAGVQVDFTMDFASDFRVLKTNLEAGRSVKLSKDIEFTEPINISTSVSINGNGYKIKYAEGYTGSLFNIQPEGNFIMNNVIIDGENNWEYGEDEYTVITEENKTDITAFSIINKGILEIYNSTFKNIFSTQSAGIIKIYETTKLTVNNSNITNCASNTMLVGGNSVNNVEVNFSGFDFNTNFAKYVNYFELPLSTVSINNCNYTENTATSSFLYIRNPAAQINNTVISNNKCNGIILYIHRNADLEFKNSIIVNNICSVVFQNYLSWGNGYKFISGEIKDNTITGSDTYIVSGVFEVGNNMRMEGNVNIFKNGIFLNNGIINGNVLIDVAITELEVLEHINNGIINGNVTLQPNKSDGTTVGTFTNNGTINGEFINTNE